MKKAISTEDTAKINQLVTDVAVILNEVGYIKEDMRGMRANLEKDYVTQDQFEPIKRVVYGLVSIILTAVVVALVALVVIR